MGSGSAGCGRTYPRSIARSTTWSPTRWRTAVDRRHDRPRAARRSPGARLGGRRTTSCPRPRRDRLLPLAKVVGAGPPREVVELCEWAAWRWAGTGRAPAAGRVPAERGARPAPLALSARPRAAARRAPGRVSRGRPPGTGATSSPSGSPPTGSTLVIVAGHEPARRVAQAARARRAPDARAARHRARRGAHSGLGRRPRRAVRRGRRPGRGVGAGARTSPRSSCSTRATRRCRRSARRPGTPATSRSSGRGGRARRSRSSRRRRRSRPRRSPDRRSRPDRSVERDGWPIVEVVDPREEPPGTGLLTGPLAPALHHAIDHGGRAVCVLNRRGRARLLACVTCNELARCERCGAFVEETESGTLRCARCALERPDDLPALPRHPAEGTAARRVAGARRPRRVAAAGRGGRGRRVDGRARPAGRCSSAPRRCCTGCRPDRRCCSPRSSTSTRSCSRRAYRAAEQALGLLARGRAPGRPRANGRPAARADPAARPRGARGRAPGRPDGRRRRGAAAPRGARATRRSACWPRCGARPRGDALHRRPAGRSTTSTSSVRRSAATGLQALVRAPRRRRRSATRWRAVAPAAPGRGSAADRGRPTAGLTHLIGSRAAHDERVRIRGSTGRSAARSRARRARGRRGRHHRPARRTSS